MCNNADYNSGGMPAIAEIDLDLVSGVDPH